jgi:hypothetical protein
VSSSSCADRPARRLLRDAFAVLRDEAAAHHAMLCGALAALPVNVAVGGEALAPQVTGDELAVGDPCEAPRVAIATRLATVLALLEARYTVVEAVARGDLDLRGTADALDAAADAFAVFLHGLVRAPSSARLLDELRSAVRFDPEADHGK